MRKRRIVNIPIKCALESCQNMFVRKYNGDRYCCEKCRKKSQRIQADIRNTAKREERKLKQKQEYVETVKCPKCGETYTVSSDTPPPGIMRRKYCRTCSATNLEPYHTFSISTER